MKIIKGIIIVTLILTVVLPLLTMVLTNLNAVYDTAYVIFSIL